MKRIILNSLVILAIGSGCKQEDQTKPRVTSLGVYKVVVDNNQPKMGAPLYKEAFEYNTEGQVVQHFQYDELGSLKSREIYPENYEANDTIKTSFYDSSNTLQSNYEKIYNSNHQKTEVWAFDASNSELLRREKYIYDSDDNLIEKQVYTADDMLYRQQLFEYDENGNEIKVNIKDENGQTIFEEEYEISSLDGRKMWTEKWGYSDGSPSSFRKRVLEYD